VNGHTQFLHDGRARNLMEAILWHGGEAEEAKEVLNSADLPQLGLPASARVRAPGARPGECPDEEGQQPMVVLRRN